MRKTPNMRYLWLAPLVAAFLAACAQPPVPEDHFYRLRVTPPERPLAEPPLDGILEVERLAADGLTAGRPIVYSQSGKPHELKEYHYHFWTEPPTVMLRDQLVVYLRAAGVATEVVTPELRVEPDYVLAGKIRRLERILGTPPRVVVEIELGLRRSDGGRLLHLETYHAEAEAGADTVAAAVEALNGALAGIYAKFAEDIGRK